MRLLTEIGLFIYRIFTPFRTARLEKELKNANKIILNNKTSSLPEKSYTLIMHNNSSKYGSESSINVNADSYKILVETTRCMTILFELEGKQVRKITLEREYFKAII